MTIEPLRPRHVQGGQITFEHVVFEVKNDKAVRYIESQLEAVRNDSYTLAVVAYALRLANAPRKDEAIEMLNELKIEGAGEVSGILFEISFTEIYISEQVSFHEQHCSEFE